MGDPRIVIKRREPAALERKPRVEIRMSPEVKWAIDFRKNMESAAEKAYSPRIKNHTPVLNQLREDLSKVLPVESNFVTKETNLEKLQSGLKVVDHLLNAPLVRENDRLFTAVNTLKDSIQRQTISVLQAKVEELIRQ